MKKLKKFFAASLVFLSLISVLSAKEESIDEMLSEDFDAMFDQAEDVEAVKTESTAAEEKKVDDGTFKLRFSGHLDSEVGFACLYAKDSDNKPTGYFTFNNYLYFDARPTKESVIHGTLGIGFPGYSFGVSECYFDYIVKNILYFTAGKKGTTWGYTRLFSTSSTATQAKIDESVVKSISAENTNILSDSSSGTTIMMRVPVGTGTITGLALYKGTSTTPELKDLIFAGSIEFVIEKTSFNVFGRAGKNEIKTINGFSRPVGPLVGLEVKRTILGADVYGQGLARFDTNRKFIDIFKGNNFHETTFQQFVFTGGLYRWWDEIDYPIGFNIEYQFTRSIWSQEYVLTSTKNAHALAFDGGIKKLGKNHNIKLGVEYSHNITNKTGYIKPGILVSGIFPGCDWKNGVKWDYGKDLPASGKWTIGTYFTLALDY